MRFAWVQQRYAAPIDSAYCTPMSAVDGNGVGNANQAHILIPESIASSRVGQVGVCPLRRLPAYGSTYK